MSRLSLIILFVLFFSLPLKSLAMPCDPDKRWDEGTNELSKETEKCNDLVGKVRKQNKPETEFELQEKMLSEKGPISDLPIIERETSFSESFEPGTIGEMLNKIKESPDVQNALGNVEEMAEARAAKIAGFDDSGVDAATKISFDDASSLTNGAFSNKEFSDISLTETAIEAMGLDAMAVMIGQMLMPSFDTPTFTDHMSGVEKARLALSFIPIVSQIYNLGADIAEAVQGGVSPAGVAEIVTIDLFRDFQGFFLPETPAEQWVLGGIIGSINQQGAANKAASKIVDALAKDDYNHKVVSALQKKVGQFYFDTVCPVGTIEGAYGCLVDRIDDHAGRTKWSHFVSNDVLYVRPMGGQCPPQFHFDGSNCRSDPEIVTVGRKVWNLKEGSIWISRWPHQCEDDTTFDGHNCKVNGIDGGMKDRHPVVKENRLYISAIGNHCPDGYKYNNLYHLCQRNKIIRMDGRKAWTWKDSLYTSPAKPPNPRDVALYLSHAELYQKWGDPNKIYDSVLNSKDYSKKF
ncbi:hypothetical protein [Endozoicomonas arenosclerae]|uniref:hypothetical protein n=1 Tax=Endozoicomonas arenosclerae TaxID=1633495 RepID=UPI000A4FD63B|nr:hypothetical protein [Endozoicomonas arenosclerae]